ncbi:aspartate--tRNA ligase [Clostridium beijerinckii]|jgi:aspartyl-tRNA synthetase (EC 6.1.1.12)|uniref:Aspartate--tRNA ligase n=2 Tax=Clostridium beijerinckii TaxID=1520 RepID=SYD_CLOB8|nr:aspartate--tRNA ligase [Clostridium beijerinckii]A6LTP1.1 RecName: Full=Aspartate--tRNA ligase; AltName: Full=Aspartyl-tRNA synthetase; Short=AspRS [Clostridium beijerinckii NCIMB 8052]ABR33721.1 aspartyl-tRNA synthetase [Clostridium beijerinckii NCIMB 8052]AIU00236.1 aspartyl-tRNA synthetase [Clostridium beijerinckii ATCC 35702]MBF7812143.1 aspartate--tRNA ligase [Clostridium beijerinckii]NRT25000.1 aspartyl-tRNA synthetase [Clostridium beijerinckii]NRT67406.1 aspartyl-tRNA synthetase [Cl
MGESLNGLKRTMMCGEPREEHVGKKITLMGWVQRNRKLGALEFVDLRDKTGIMQVVFGEEINAEAFEKAKGVRSEYCVAVTGEVVKRESVNENMPTGFVELKCENIKILSESETPPIYIKEDLDAAENIRLKYRYLDLRRSDMHKIFEIRSKTTKAIRDYLEENNFLDVETPILSKSSPEGARDYLVPSRNYPGMFYALPQSPQIFKQLLMVSGFDRYYQIAKCFRDEDLRANRQPEFTQVDMELSFVEQEDIMAVNEGLIAHVFKKVAGVDVQLPIKRMTFKDAMEKYGSDKPDLRFGMEITNITEDVKDLDFVVFKSAIEAGGSVRALCLKCGADLGRKPLDKLGEFVKTYKAKGLAWIQIKEDGVKSSIAKFLTDDVTNSIVKTMNAETGDAILIVADKNSVVFQSLGALRLELAKQFDLIKDKNEFNFTWITEFPLFEYSEEEERYKACHHPFTAPMDEDLDFIESDPGNVRSKAYDLVLNGEELGGGSIRIHDTALQERMFRALGLTDEVVNERFGYLLQAFKFGPPPHGGLAFGLDRMIMFLAGTENIKDVIAFPKNQNAYCYLSEAPNIVDEKQLTELGIAILPKEEKNDKE